MECHREDYGSFVDLLEEFDDVLNVNVREKGLEMNL